MISASPAAEIRRYLDQHGTVEVPFHNLLTTWNLEEPTSIDRQQIVTELADAGIAVSPPLVDVAPDDSVKLSLRSDTQNTVIEPAWQNGNGAPAMMLAAPGGPPAGLTYVAPPIGPAAGSSGRSKLRTLGVVLGLLLLVAGGTAAGFFYGVGTRPTDSQIDAKLASQAAKDKRAYTNQMRDALKTQKKRLTEKMTKEQTEAVAAATQRGQAAGYSSGQSAGYASGREDGQEAGYSEGVERGFTEATDEVTCSDDPDVPLPYC